MRPGCRGPQLPRRGRPSRNCRSAWTPRVEKNVAAAVDLRRARASCSYRAVMCTRTLSMSIGPLALRNHGCPQRAKGVICP